MPYGSSSHSFFVQFRLFCRGGSAELSGIVVTDALLFNFNPIPIETDLGVLKLAERWFNSASASQFGSQTLKVKLRLLPGRNTVQVRGDPPAFAIYTGGGEGCRAEARKCGGGLSQPLRLRLGRPFRAGVAQQRQQQFRKLPGNSPLGSASLPVGPILCSRSSTIRAGGFEPSGCR